MTGSNGWLLVSEAARELERSPSQVTRLARAGRLQGEKIWARGGMEWRLSRESVEAFKRERGGQQEKLARIRELRRAGLSWARIGRELGTPSRAAAQAWFQRNAPPEEYESLR